MRGSKLVALFGCNRGDRDVGRGCGGEAVEAVERPLAKPINLSELLENKGESNLVRDHPRARGRSGYLQPISRRQRNEMVTTFRVQNNSTGALAAFKVDEFWYDRAGDTVAGGSFRMPRPLLAGEIIEVEIRIPRDRRMSRNNYEFSHKNGVIETTLFEEMDEPTPIEEEEGRRSRTGLTRLPGRACATALQWSCLLQGRAARGNRSIRLAWPKAPNGFEIRLAPSRFGPTPPLHPANDFSFANVSRRHAVSPPAIRPAAASIPVDDPDVRPP